MTGKSRAASVERSRWLGPPALHGGPFAEHAGERPAQMRWAALRAGFGTRLCC